MTMLDYIEEQPKVLKDALKSKEAITKKFCTLFEVEQPDQIYLIASGTSYNAAKAAAPFVESILSCQVIVLPPSRVCHIFGRKPMFLLISQGGKSTNILHIAEVLREKKSKFTEWGSCITMTGSPEGKLNNMCDAYIEIPCGEENIGPKSKGYMATILTLYMMALEAAYNTDILSTDKYAEYYSVLDEMVESLSRNIERSKLWVEENMESLKDFQQVYLVGKQQSMSIAQEGALKIMETYLVSSMAFDFEEYMHGPSCSLREKTAGFYLLPESGDFDYERMQKLAMYHRNICKSVYIVGCPGLVDKRDCRLVLSGHWYTQPFEYILPLQMISAIIPDELGIGGVGMKRFKEIDKFMDVKYKEKEG